MSSVPEPIERAANAFDRLPGLGPRAALRYVAWLASQPKEVILSFARSVEALATSLQHCDTCHQWTDAKRCPICRDTHRDAHLICVVAISQDIRPIEESGAFRGTYHVLGGTINPLEDRGVQDLAIPSLLERVRPSSSVQEILIALDSDVAGDATSLYLQQALKPFSHLKITRLARGLPSGASLEYTDPLTLLDAIRHRRT